MSTSYRQTGNLSNFQKSAETAAGVHAVFSKIAKQYDRFNLISSLGICRHWLRVLVDESATALARCTPAYGSQLGSQQLGGSQLGSSQLGSPKLGSSQLGSSRLGGQQLGGSQLGSQQLGDSQLGGPQRCLNATAENPQIPLILDIAGGTGEVSFALARRFATAQIVLSDFCQPMLDVAAERITSGEINRSQAARITLRQADAQQLPFEDASFNLVTCAYGLRNLPRRDLGLMEAFRVLKPGGSLLICEFSHPPSVLWGRAYNAYLGLVIPTVGGLLTGNKAEFCYLRDSIKSFPEQTAICEMLYNVGFADISYRNLTGGIVCLHIAVKSAGNDSLE